MIEINWLNISFFLSAVYIVNIVFWYGENKVNQLYVNMKKQAK